MIKSINTKFWRSLLLLISFALFCCLSGCGGGEDAADKAAANGLQIAAFTGSPTTLASGQSSILTAKVFDSSGNPASGQVVAFTLLSNNSLATITTQNGGITDAGGQAFAVYKAGANTPTSSVQDTIQASVTGAVGTVIITRTASTAPDTFQMSLTANPTTLAAGQSSIITATVTNGSGNPAQSQAVTFGFVTGANNSGAPDLTVVNGTTDASGRAIAVYTAGVNTPASSVQDTIQASVTGASGAVIITRTGTAISTPAGYQMSLTADVTSLAAGQSSIITATVRNGANVPISGQVVTFGFVTGANKSGAPDLTVVNGTTDASGKAVATYTAGADTPASSVQDIVQASVTGASGAVIITRTAAGSGSGTGVRMTVSATPSSLASGAMSVIVAKVYNADGTDAAGKVVTFGFVTDANNSGAPDLTVVNGTTDAGGTAIATYTAGNNSPSLSIQDVVQATVSGSAGAVIITRLPTAGTGNRIISFIEDPETTKDTLNGNPGPLGPPYVNVIMKVKVTTDNLTSPVVDETVTFSIITGNGILTDPNDDTNTGSSITAITDTNGEAWVYFTRPDTGVGDTVVRAQIPGTTNGGDAARIVYWTDEGAP